jgi:hypothetical protein
MLADTPVIIIMSADTNVANPDDSSKPPPRTMAGDKIRTKKWAPKTFNGCLTCKYVSMAFSHLVFCN